MNSLACPTCRRRTESLAVAECPRCHTDLAPLAALEREFNRCCLRAAHALRAGELDAAEGALRRAAAVHADAAPVRRLAALLALARQQFAAALRHAAAVAPRS